MNKGDCFVLDSGKIIYVYMGNASKKIERLKAIQAGSQVRDQDHGGKAKIVILGWNFILECFGDIHVDIVFLFVC